MRPLKQYPIVLDNRCNAIFNSEDLILAIYARAEKPVCRVKAVFIWHGYPAISIYDKKHHVHRLIAEYKLGRILQRHESAHHIDGNPLNALWENINVLHQGDHVRLHLKGRKQDPEFARRRTTASLVARGLIHTEEQA